MADISCGKFRWPGLRCVYIDDSKGVIQKAAAVRIYSCRAMAARSGRAGSTGISLYLQEAGNQLYILLNRK